jgi:hypothetical protein
MPATRPEFEPSPAAIRRAAEKIQRTWSAAERARREVQPSARPVEIKVFSRDDVRTQMME